MEIIVELYICKSCQHVELELNGPCPECGGDMECVDFIPARERIETMTEEYDSTNDVLEHVERVGYWMRDFAQQLIGCAKYHDDSKHREPEKSCFDAWIPVLKQVQFGSDEYYQALEGMGEGLKHHYAVNRHHPEHHPNGINDMTLVDVVEMLCDWMAAAEAKKVNVDLAHLSERFSISPQLTQIFLNTLREVDFFSAAYNDPVPEFAPRVARFDSMAWR